MKLDRAMVILLCLLPHTVVVADPTTVYEKMEPDGIPQFSDSSSADATVEHIREPNLMDATKTDIPASTDTTQQDKTQHLTLNIIKPAAQKSFWSGNGDVEVSFDSSLAVDTSVKYDIFLDGQIIASTTQHSTMLNNLDRGKHSLKVQVSKQTKGVRGESATITFYLHRPHQ